MTRYEKQLLKYITGLLILILTTIYGGYIVLFKEESQTPRITLYKTETHSGRAIFYKKIGDEFFIVTQEEVEILLENDVEVIDK